MRQISIWFLIGVLAVTVVIWHRSKTTEKVENAFYDRTHLEKMVDDSAGLLTPAERKRIAEYHAMMIKGYDIDYRVIIARDLQDINLYAAQKFEALSVGAFSKTGRGLLLVLDPAADKLRVEVGRNLEGVYVDAFIAYIEQNQMIPFFRADQVANGILATTELMITRAQEAGKNQAFDPSSVLEVSAGGGAAASAYIGQAGGRKIPESVGSVVTSLTPSEVVLAHTNAARKLEHGPAWIYTHETIASRRTRPITRAQLKNGVKMYDSCKNERVFIQGDYAVVRFDILPRSCWPFLLKKEDGQWRLDFIASRTFMVSNQNNKWFFKANVPPPHYAFAFKDWDFDRNGFPVYRKN